MEITDQREVFGPSHDEFHSDKIVGIEGESVLSFWNGDQSLPPTVRQSFKDRVAQDVGMITVDPKISAVLAERLIQHGGCEFVEGIGAEVGVESGSKRTLGISQRGK